MTDIKFERWTLIKHLTKCNFEICIFCYHHTNIIQRCYLMIRIQYVQDVTN